MVGDEGQLFKPWQAQALMYGGEIRASGGDTMYSGEWVLSLEDGDGKENGGS